MDKPLEEINVDNVYDIIRSSLGIVPLAPDVQPTSEGLKKVSNVESKK